MMKTWLNLRDVPICASIKRLYVVSLILFFTFWLPSNLWSASAPTSEKTVTFKVERASLENVINIIRNKTGIKFFYSVDKIKDIKNISVNIVKTPVSDVMTRLLEGTALTFTYVDDVIVIKDKSIPLTNYIVMTGRVTRPSGEPVAGANVIAKGTSFGTATDGNGEYTLKFHSSATAITFSFIGMKPREISCAGKTVINVVLEDDEQTVEDVVVTGYQIIKKREMTSSITTLYSKDLLEPTYGTLDKMLQGKVPGMAVMNQSSTIGAAPKIRIRGSSSILGNREPVWVLDGIILEDPVKLDVTELNSMDRVNLIGNAISSINPEDIDRIDILKDASATAIYGVKAANGVIVITTKRGKFGPPSVNYSMSMSMVQRPTTDMMKVMNSKERIELSEEMHNRGLQFVGSSIPVGSVGYEGLLTQLWQGNISRSQFDNEVKSLKELNTDWYDLLFRNSFSNSHTLSVSGATEKVGYYFSAGYSNRQGASVQEKQDRYNFMSNMDFKISEKFRASVSLVGSYSKGARPHGSIDLYSYAYNTSRAIPVYNSDGSLFYYDRALGIAGSPNLKYNILNELENTGNASTDHTLNTNLNIDYKIVKGLNFNAVASYNTGVNRQESWVSDRSYFASSLRRTAYGYEIVKGEDLVTFKKNSELPFGGINDQKFTESTTYTTRASLNYNKMITKDHSVSASAGMEIRGVHYEGSDYKTLGYLPDRGKKVAVIDPLVYTGYGQYSRNYKPLFSDNISNFMSYYGILSYGFQNRYILSGNIRGDASNRLGQDKSARFLPIWSLSGRWNISNEAFMNSVMWVDDLAVRASYGVQGNVTDAHNPNMIVSLGSLDTQSEQYISTLASLPNPGLLWERTQSFNLGLDMSFLKGRLALTAEFYTKRGEDQLVTVIVPTTSGASSMTLNAGTMQNKGWELSVNARLIDHNDFKWSMSFNTSKNYNKVTNSGFESSETYGNYINGSLIRNGKSVNSFYSYRYGGLNDLGLPIFNGINAKDADGNVLISNRAEAFEQAFAFSGNREPDFTGGFSTYFKYKNLSVNALFSFALGVNVRLNNLYLRDDQRLPYPEENMQNEFVNRWRKPGDVTDIPVITDANTSIGGYAYLEGGSPVVARNIWQMYNYSDLRVVPGDFLRCRNISLSYAFSKDLLKGTLVKAVTLTCGVSNPFVIKSKSLKGRDPEQSTLGSGAIPPQSTYTFGLNVTF